MPSTWISDTATLASTCQGSCRCQLSQWIGKRRLNQTTGQASASHMIPLDHSQTTGSQVAYGRSFLRMSVTTV